MTNEVDEEGSHPSGNSDTITAFPPHTSLTEQLKQYPPGATIVNGMLSFWEDGREILSSFDSGSNCDGAGLMAHTERCRQADTSAKQTERTAAKAELRRTEAVDKAALGEVFGALASLIRKNMAAAKRRPAAPKRTQRRRRRLKD
jgi:hypothetical protein